MCTHLQQRLHDFLRPGVAEPNREPAVDFEPAVPADALQPIERWQVYTARGFLPTFPSAQVVYRIDLHYTQLWPSAPNRLTPCVFRTGSRDLPRTSRTLGVWKYSSRTHGEGREGGTQTETERNKEKERSSRYSWHLRPSTLSHARCQATPAPRPCDSMPAI